MKTLAAALLSLAALAPSGAGAAPADWPRKLTVGAIPTESSTGLTDRYEILLKHLERRLGIPVELKTATDYNGVVTALQFKHVDVAYLGPKAYVDAAARANAEAFVIEVAEDGSAGYKGIIIARAGSPLRTVADLKGKTWAFTDPSSTSGTLVPTVHFVKDLKIEPERFFSKVTYSGSHEASILAVKAGKVDAASTNDLDLARGVGKSWLAEDFQILWTSALIPGSPMAWRKDLPESLKAAVKEAFTSFADAEGLKKLKLKGYAPCSDATYDPIREQIEVKKQLANK